MQIRIPTGATLPILALFLLTGAAAAQRAPAPIPLAIVDGSVGISLSETPLTFSVGGVIPGSLRISVPLRYGIQPWVAGAVAHMHDVACDSIGPGCSNTEKRALIGASYQPGGRGMGRAGGPYIGVGLGVREYRGQKDFAHSIVLGLPFAIDSPLAPSIELRSESYRTFQNEILIVAVGFRLGIGG